LHFPHTCTLPLRWWHGSFLRRMWLSRRHCGHGGPSATTHLTPVDGTATVRLVNARVGDMAAVVGDLAAGLHPPGGAPGRQTHMAQCLTCVSPPFKLAPIPCTCLSPDTENDSCPIVSEPVHVTFANDRLSSPVALRSGRSQPIVIQVTCAPDRSQPHRVSASVVA